LADHDRRGSHGLYPLKKEKGHGLLSLDESGGSKVEGGEREQQHDNVRTRKKSLNGSCVSSDLKDIDGEEEEERLSDDDAADERIREDSGASIRRGMKGEPHRRSDPIGIFFRSLESGNGGESDDYREEDLVLSSKLHDTFDSPEGHMNAAGCLEANPSSNGLPKSDGGLSEQRNLSNPCSNDRSSRTFSLVLYDSDDDNDR